MYVRTYIHVCFFFKKIHVQLKSSGMVNNIEITTATSDTYVVFFKTIKILYTCVVLK